MFHLTKAGVVALHIIWCIQIMTHVCTVFVLHTLQLSWFHFWCQPFCPIKTVDTITVTQRKTMKRNINETTWGVLVYIHAYAI